MRRGASRQRSGSRNTIRIIGGEWRGRKLTFPEVEGIRPTPDRVRETLFNWLQPMIHGARCLDLFAGSGALGLEALSRGAAEVFMVDRDVAVVRSLRTHGETLNAQGLRVQQADALQLLAGSAQPFDVVFLDPPFRKGLLEECCRRLEAGGWLTDNAYIYMEMESESSLDFLPENWEVIRNKQAGQVGYYLAQRG